ncbi:MAG: ArsR family transcriptional regulator [Chloroflexi bacterium]|nr:ArsR family transcriptional regulator [Chloroflexota bacterium]
MESTREQVLRLLQGHGGATVAQLADELGIGPASIRRHLDHLRAERLADVRLERHGVGRPSFVFYPTEEGGERSPAGYSRLLSRLYAGLRSLDERQVRGCDGDTLLRTTFDAAAKQLAQEHQSEVAGDSLEDRVAQTSRALQPEGIVDDWSKHEDGYHLTNSACPYWQAAHNTGGPCELDRRAIELLVASPVRQVSRIADGQPTCEYIVAAGPPQRRTTE